VLFWYLLVTVVPFLVMSWRTPNTYPKGGVRQGTAASNSKSPGQPPSALPPESLMSRHANP